LQSIDHENIQRCPLAQDLIENLNAIEEMEEDERRDVQVIFDPYAFTGAHPAPSKQEFQLDESSLEQWAIQGTSIRAKIKLKANRYGEESTQTEVADSHTRSRRGIVPSIASRSPAGLTEKEIKRQSQLDITPCRQYRPR